MHRKTAKQLHLDFCSGRLTAVAIVQHYLKRIEAFDKDIGAFLVVFKERVLKQAEALDQKRASGATLGKLAGVPIGLKDNIHVEGELTTCASKFLTNYRAVFDATVTRLIEQEDGLILGKLNLDEFAMGSSMENSALQSTSNPWDLSRVPGGSSGASAAAVAAGLCPIALGSDTGGSVRQPAAFCGCVGFKPTYGRVSRYGLVAFGSSLDQIGPLACFSEDIAWIMEVLGQHDPYDATSLTQPPVLAQDVPHDFKGRRIGIPSHVLDQLSPAARKSWDQALDVYRSLGCECIDIRLDLLEPGIATYYIIATAEAATNLARFDGIRYGVRAEAKTLDEVYVRSRSQGFGTEVKRRIMLGTYVLSSGYQDAFYKKATQVRSKMMQEYERIFQICDVIATPVTPNPAFKKGAILDPVEMYLQDIFTIPANLAKLPAISHPIAQVEGLPFGLQLMGPQLQDALVYGFAMAYERHVGPVALSPYFDQEA